MRRSSDTTWVSSGYIAAYQPSPDVLAQPAAAQRCSRPALRSAPRQQVQRVLGLAEDAELVQHLALQALELRRLTRDPALLSAWRQPESRAPQTL